jgi:hypothetical protein
VGSRVKTKSEQQEVDPGDQSDNCERAKIIRWIQDYCRISGARRRPTEGSAHRERFLTQGFSQGAPCPRLGTSVPSLADIE